MFFFCPSIFSQLRVILYFFVFFFPRELNTAQWDHHGSWLKTRKVFLNKYCNTPSVIKHTDTSLMWLFNINSKLCGWKDVFFLTTAWAHCMSFVRKRWLFFLLKEILFYTIIWLKCSCKSVFDVINRCFTWLSSGLCLTYNVFVV